MNKFEEKGLASSESKEELQRAIDEKLEGTELYMDFFKPGDLFILLADITALVKKP